MCQRTLHYNTIDFGSDSGRVLCAGQTPTQQGDAISGGMQFSYFVFLVRLSGLTFRAGMLSEAFAVR